MGIADATIEMLTVPASKVVRAISLVPFGEQGRTASALILVDPDGTTGEQMSWKANLGQGNLLPGELVLAAGDKISVATYNADQVPGYILSYDEV